MRYIPCVISETNHVKLSEIEVISSPATYYLLSSDTSKVTIMISVIIPALNEETTIRRVIQRIRQSEKAIEIIVVDDNSYDNTVSEALKEKVRVITSSRKGKGISMREGMMAASHNIIVYLDADILTYPKNIVSILAEPILKEEADFVKSYFDRQAGRVTQLVAKPLLSIFFPELEKFMQPLSGMIAARKDFLQQIEFENDYGVDIALLIDAYNKNIRIKEVNIGYIKNDMQSLESLGKMSRQVSRTILQKAGSLSNNNLETLSGIYTISDEMEISIKETLLDMKKMILIDINILMEYDFNEIAVAYFGQSEHYNWLLKTYGDPAERLEKTAMLLKGKSLPELQFIADTIPLAKNAAEIIKELKNKGYVCVLVSEGFDVVANHIKNKLGFDYCFSNFLELDKSVATGALTIAECFTPGDNKEVYDKSFVLEYATKKFGIHGKNTVFVGNSPEDIPMLKNAGMGVVTSNALPETSIWADKIIPANSLESILDITHSSVNKKSILGQKVKYTLLGAVALGTAAAGYYLYNKIKKKEEITEA
ncbi:MAG: hypothetical protein BGP13_17835 [Sphingobacteriales bacterium 40-81]|nr:MAG: hypothetical protein BGP13_17835 [Sphingobacteriales bacterium 40-81]